MTTILQNRFVEVYLDESKKAIVIKSVSEFIPENSFKEIFGEVMKNLNRSIHQVIFDKSSLKVFHQPSMEWYHLEWKKEVFEKFGLKTYRKILPKDKVFRESVRIGREKIFGLHPNHIVHQLDIQYVESIDEV